MEEQANAQLQFLLDSLSENDSLTPLFDLFQLILSNDVYFKYNPNEIPITVSVDNREITEEILASISIGIYNEQNRPVFKSETESIHIPFGFQSCEDAIESSRSQEIQSVLSHLSAAPTTPTLGTPNSDKYSTPSTSVVTALRASHVFGRLVEAVSLENDFVEISSSRITEKYECD